jgi:hypothetical protein
MTSRFLKSLLLAALVLGAAAPFAPEAQALSGADWNPGDIISQAVFTDNTRMSVAGIQQFLNSKVTCDTNGTTAKSYYYNPSNGYLSSTASQPGASWVTTSRAVYGQRYDTYFGTGIAGAPYVCVRDYVENPTTHENNLQRAGASIGGGESAAQIIYDAAQANGINPMVLLVTLQKEENLVSDDWPWLNQYKTAMGYGCPDGAACDAQYFGFANQVGDAAWQFRRYLTVPQNFNYVTGTNFIKWSPNAACGGSNVNIANLSTAALYDYTPYQPNTAALAGVSDTSAGGTGDGCSAYGNRNFWWYFNRWFGSTQTNVPYAWTLSGSDIFADSARTTAYSVAPTLAITPGGTAYITLLARNNGNQNWSASNVRLGTVQPRDRSSSFSDSSWLTSTRVAMQETTVQPGEVATFKFDLAAPATPGSYRECFNVVAEGFTWIPGPDTCYNIDVVQPQDPNSQNLTLNSGEQITAGQFLMSPSAHSVAVVQHDGNFVLYNDGIAQWNSNTVHSPASKLVMQADGNLVLYTDAGGAFWSSGTGGNPGAHAALQSDGNLVVYSSGGTPLWFTHTEHVPSYSKTVQHGLQNGPLYPGQSLQMADRSHQLLMQADGNLVLYSNNHPVWATFTQGHPGSFLVMQPDGNFVLYGPDLHPLWATWTNGNPGSRLMLQDDSNMVIYRPDGSWVWQSFTRGQ